MNVTDEEICMVSMTYEVTEVKKHSRTSVFFSDLRVGDRIFISSALVTGRSTLVANNIRIFNLRNNTHCDKTQTQMFNMLKNYELQQVGSI